VADNGLDEDCSGRDASSRDLPSPERRDATGTGKRPNLVLVTIDTLRADRTVDPRVMPRLHAWSEGGTQFERAYTPSPATLPALGSLFCGQEPRKLAWIVRIATSASRIVDRGALADLPADEVPWYATPYPRPDACTPLPELLRGAGYHTAAVVAGSAPFLAQAGFGVVSGFERYEGLAQHTDLAQDDEGTTQLALRVLEERPADRPIFLWVHYFGPHEPSEHHPILGPLPVGVTAQYDHEVAFTDQALAPLLATLDALASRAPTLVTVTADHGEELAGQSRGHGHSLSDDVTRIPLVLRGTGVAEGQRIGTPVSLLDVMPTLLLTAHEPVPVDVRGLNLTAQKGAAASERMVLSERWSASFDGTFVPGEIAAIGRDAKVMLEFDTVDEAAFSVLDQGERPSAWRSEHFRLGTQLRAYVERYPVRRPHVDPHDGWLLGTVSERLQRWWSRLVSSVVPTVEPAARAPREHGGEDRRSARVPLD